MEGWLQNATLPVVSIPAFRDAMLPRVQPDLPIPELAEQQVDISVEEVRMISAFEQVEALIQQELQAAGFASRTESIESQPSSQPLIPVHQLPPPPQIPQLTTGRTAHDAGTSTNVQVLPTETTSNVTPSSPPRPLPRFRSPFLQPLDETASPAFVSGPAGVKLKTKRKPTTADEDLMPDMSGSDHPLSIVAPLTGPVEPLQPDDVILSIAFYGPKKPKMKVAEYLVLATQPLTALKDRLYCLYDNEELDVLKTKSGCFFIENTFYSDLRKPGSIDYAPYYLQWAEHAVASRRTRGGEGAALTDTLEDRFVDQLRRFRAVAMEGVTWQDVPLRVGAKYVYVHQGDCEHVMVVRDVRLPTDSDPKDRRYYPYVAWHAKLRRRRCHMCCTYPAKYVTYGDKHSPENPCFYCERCYRPFHYTFEGRLLYQDYEVYPYFHE